jgi:hypothetical protein
VKLFKRVDILIFIVAIIIIILSFTTIGSVGGKPTVKVTSNNKEWYYDLSVNTFATFKGPVGETTIEIKDNKVRVVESDCNNKVCISSGWVSESGQWIICLPNDVFVLIEGDTTNREGDQVDDTSF